MESDDKIITRLLKENLRLTRENNKLLKKIRRSYLLGLFSRILFTVMLLGIPFALYRYYLKDYVIDLQTTYDEIQKDLGELRSVPGRFLENKTE